MQSKIEKIVPSGQDSSLAGAVIVQGSGGESTTLEADVVVMGVGVAPATEYLKSSKGFEQVVGRDGAVQVDEFLKVKGIDNVYAIGASTFPIWLWHSLTTLVVGDIALYPQPGTGELRRIEHWNVGGHEQYDRICLETHHGRRSLGIRGVPLVRLSRRARVSRS